MGINPYFLQERSILQKNKQKGDDFVIGIYAIKSKATQKMYIGESLNIILRWKSHKKELNNNSHHNYKLQTEWNKYGEDNFEFHIIESFDYESNCIVDKRKLYLALLCREHYNIKKFDTIDNGFNIELTLKEVVRGTCKNQELMKYMDGFALSEIKLHKNLYKEVFNLDVIISYTSYSGGDLETITIPCRKKRVHKNTDLILVSRINKYVQEKIGIKYTNRQLKELFTNMGLLRKISDKSYTITETGINSGYLEQGYISINGYSANKILLTPDGIDFLIDYLQE